MFATIGYIVPEYFKWPGYLSPSAGLKFEDVPNGLNESIVGFAKGGHRAVSPFVISLVLIALLEYL